MPEQPDQASPASVFRGATLCVPFRFLQLQEPYLKSIKGKPGYPGSVGVRVVGSRHVSQHPKGKAGFLPSIIKSLDGTVGRLDWGARMYRLVNSATASSEHDGATF